MEGWTERIGNNRSLLFTIHREHAQAPIERDAIRLPILLGKFPSRIMAEISFSCAPTRDGKKYDRKFSIVTCFIVSENLNNEINLDFYCHEKSNKFIFIENQYNKWKSYQTVKEIGIDICNINIKINSD